MFFTDKLGLPHAALLSLVLSLAACTLPRPNDVAIDAAPDGPVAYHVSGTMRDMWPGAMAELELTTGSESESLTVKDDAAFVFARSMHLGDPYAVTIKFSPPDHVCTISNGVGVITAEPIDVAVSCRIAMIDVSAPVPFDFHASTFTYDIPMSLLTQDLTLTVHAPTATVIKIDGTVVLDETPHQISFPVGITSAEVEITIDGSLQKYALKFVRGAAPIKQSAYLKPPAADSGDDFGSSIAIDGALLAVGAPREDSSARSINGDVNDNHAQASGAVYVYQRTGRTWAYDAYLKADNSDAGDLFGTSVSVSGDLIAVGAPGESSASRTSGSGESDNTAASTGAVYIFERTGAFWNQRAYLKAANADPGDRFGESVTLRDNLLIVTAPGEASAAAGVNGDQSDNTLRDSGAAYVFRRQATGSWAFEAYLKSPTPHESGWFGGSVGSRSTVAIFSQGAIITDYGGAWSFPYLTEWMPPYAPIRAPNESRGISTLALAKDRLVAGSDGAVWAFSDSFGDGGFDALDHTISSSSSQYYGTAVGAFGDLAAVGDAAESGTGRGIDPPMPSSSVDQNGAVYIFSPLVEESLQRAYIKASNTDPNDFFGRVLALSKDTLAVAALHEDSRSTGVDADQADNSGIDVGAVYVFQ